jgi:hypothetical protein
LINSTIRSCNIAQADLKLAIPLTHLVLEVCITIPCSNSIIFYPLGEVFV